MTWQEGFDLPIQEGPDKVVDLSVAIRSHIAPRSTVHVAYSDARPNAALMEMVRAFAGRSMELRLVSAGLVSVQHALIELGIVNRVAVSFAGENYPMARPNRAFQRAVAQGRVEVENWSLWTIVARLMAGSLDLSHLPVRSLIGSDMARDLPESAYREFADPFDPSRRIAAVAPLRPDVVIVQGVAADRAGNVVMAAPYGESMWGSLASRVGVIACVERVVTTEEIRRWSSLGRIPAHKVLAVCEVPFGAHPYGVFNPGFPGVAGYVPDGSFLEAVFTASKTEEGFREWIEEWIIAAGDHHGYLAALGEPRLTELTEQARPEVWRTEPATTVVFRAEGDRAVAEDDPAAETTVYTANEALVILTARLLAERVRQEGFDAILAGVGIANLAAWIAVRGLKSHGVDVDLMAEIGMFGYDPRPGEAFIFANRNLHTSKWITDVSVVLGSLVSGHGARAIGIVGAAEIDIDFQTNSTYSLSGQFLVGSGGANDILTAADEALVTVSLDRQRLVDRVAYVTCPGSKVATVVTNGGVFARREGAIILTHVMPSADRDVESTIGLIRDVCPWPFDVAADLCVEPEPSFDELALARRFDPRRDFLAGAITGHADLSDTTTRKEG